MAIQEITQREMQMAQEIVRLQNENQQLTGKLNMAMAMINGLFYKSNPTPVSESQIKEILNRFSNAQLTKNIGQAG